MNVPPNMSYEEVNDTIQLVVSRIAPAYTFYGYEVDDLKQESWIICMEALDRYNPEFALENFLAHNLANRLKNLIRKKHFNKKTLEDKKKVLMPGQLSNEEVTYYYESFLTDELNLKDMGEIIDREIPYSHRADYLKLLSGDHVSKRRRGELIDMIKDIVKKHGYEEEDEGVMGEDWV